VKCPLLTAERVQAARRAGHEPVTENAYKSMAYSRGASALGVALAMGEIASPIAQEAVLADWSLASGVASASAGIELKNNIVIVLGNAESAGGNCVIAHAVMKDAIAGCNVVACHVDSPKVVVERAEGRGAKTCGHNADQSELAPKGFITAAELT
jgi:cyanuric acid amidohydrolase